MGEVIIANVTNGLTAFMNYSSAGWVITMIVFLSIIILLYIIFRNIRRTIYGSVISCVLLIIYKISRWIGISTQEKNYIPIRWFGYIAGFILLSFVIGYILDKLNVLKRFENIFEDDKETMKGGKKKNG